MTVPRTHRHEHPTRQLPSIRDLIASIDDYLRITNPNLNPSARTGTSNTNNAAALFSSSNG
jgi:hypothetical protein